MKIQPCKYWLALLFCLFSWTSWAAITVTPGGGGSGDVTISGLAAGSYAIKGTNVYAFQATNLVNGNPTLAARRTAMPRLGIATFLTIWNGTNFSAPGPAPGYVASEEMAFQLATNMILHGLTKLGYNSICLEEGYQGATFPLENFTRFPNGVKSTVKRLKALGIKVGIYTDLTYKTCGNFWGSGGTNTIPAANLFADWDVDWIHFDTCGWAGPSWAEDVYGTFTEEGRRRQVEDFVSALRATNANIGVTFNMNNTAYKSWIGEVCNGWQLAPNSDDPTYWSACMSIDQANLSAGQFRQGHTPSWYPFSYPICDGSIADNFANGMYGASMLTVGGAAMWQSELQYPSDMIAVGTYNGVNTTLFQTNVHILRINQDPLFNAPVKTFTNGTVEAWTKKLVTGETALLVFNRGYSSSLNFTSSLDYIPVISPQTIYAAPMVTSNNITIHAQAFGFPPGEVAVFNQVLAGTNYQTATDFTINCPSNHCTLWIVSSANPKKWTERDEVYSFTELPIDGTGVTRLGIASFSVAPYYSRDGLTQANASTEAYFGLAVPQWAESATVSFMVASSYAGNVSWTNGFVYDHTTPTGRQFTDTGSSSPLLIVITNAPLTAASGTSSWVTNTIRFGLTNAPRTLRVTMNPSTNTSARHILGPVKVTWRGYTTP